MNLPDYVTSFLEGDNSPPVIALVRDWVEHKVKAMRRGGLAARGRSGRKVTVFSPAAAKRRERVRGYYKATTEE